jgi:hypothetical protein
VAQRERHQELARRTRANGRVQLHVLGALEQIGVAAREPADAQTGQAVGLGHRAQRERARVAVAGGGQALARDVLEAPVDLVAEQHDVALGRQLEHAVERGRRHLSARWVARAVDVDELRARLEQVLELVEVVRPALLVAALPHAHARARAACELERRAVAGRLDHGVVALASRP